jgi:hypothetical protein
MRETINLKGNETFSFPEDNSGYSGRRGNLIKIVIPAVLIIALGWWFLNGALAWRAVFLTNNQVYFGHFWDVPFAGTITLRNVYYLQFAEQSQQLNQPIQSPLKLVKLGDEIHGPTDEMVIPMSQVLFWETLRSDSAIVTTITNGTTQPKP